jgi:predicted dehydrogenase
MKRLKLAGIGCGGRTRTYLSLAAERMNQQFEVVAAADPRIERAEWLRRYAEDKTGFRVFSSDAALLAEDKLADIVVIGTQDSYHVKPCIEAMRKGYDVLLEKPISPNLTEVIALEREAVKLGRRVVVCHVLRYAPFYRKVKEIIASGALGEIRSLNATEGVGPWHFAHSYVRGHWRNKSLSSPIIIAKSCHDMDIISWIMDDECVSASSFGSLSYFNSAHAPSGAPARCTDGCPHVATCRYNALRYLDSERKWLQYVFDTEGAKVAEGASASDDEVREWLKTSNWGRCVFRCDNDAPDHQTAQFLFKSGQTATFTVTAFDGGRNLEIYGTKGCLKGGHALRHQAGTDADILVMDHQTGRTTRHCVDVREGGYDGHGGGDHGLVSHLYAEMTKKNPAEIESSITRAIQSHIMGFAAEESRVTGETIEIAEFLRKLNTANRC